MEEAKQPQELNLNDLKAQAYDIIAEQQHYQGRIQYLNKSLDEINKKINIKRAEQLASEKEELKAVK